MTVTEMPSASVPHNDGIQDVWQSNLEEEFKKIRHVVKKYNYVAMVIYFNTTTRHLVPVNLSILECFDIDSEYIRLFIEYAAVSFLGH